MCACVRVCGWSQGPPRLDHHLLSCVLMTSPQLELHFSLPLALLPCTLPSNEGLVLIYLWLAREVSIHQNCPLKK